MKCLREQEYNDSLSNKHIDQGILHPLLSSFVLPFLTTPNKCIHLCLKSFLNLKKIIPVFISSLLSYILLPFLLLSFPASPFTSFPSACPSHALPPISWFPQLLVKGKLWWLMEPEMDEVSAQRWPSGILTEQHQWPTSCWPVILHLAWWHLYIVVPLRESTENCCVAVDCTGLILKASFHGSCSKSFVLKMWAFTLHSTEVVTPEFFILLL